MKIAIVAPSPVPFTIGGAENLFWGLQDYINNETPHQCELLKLPTREHGFKDLLESYLAFCRLDLSHFDMVVSTKYPSWMVDHPNHVCYMLHKLRGLYDTYHFTGLPEECTWEGDALVMARRLMEEVDRNPASNQGVEELLEYLLTLEEHQVPSGALDFPGPFIRRIIHFLDAVGMARQRVKRYAAISHTVCNRVDYFPESAEPEVLYPPPRLASFECGAQDYLFTASRLDGPKRIGMLVEAMRHVNAAIPLCIAGTGPDERNIRSLAGGDSRIRFLGFVNDREVLRWYKDALAVPYIPYDEDYGLITIEAMMSGKPVLTLRDSGGPNEFVENGVTGYSVEPSPQAIARKIDALCADRIVARGMGRNARKRVEGIRWAKVVEGLLGEGRSTWVSGGKISRRPRLAVALTFPIYPPRGGGQSRVFHLYKRLARYADVELVTSCQPLEPPFHGEIAPGLTETRIPRAQAHQDAENKYSELVDWVPVTDLVMSELYKLTPDFESALRYACERADIVVASHPYLGGVLAKTAPDKPLWFEVHNVEYALKRDILPDTPEGRRLLDRVRQDEAHCWSRASLIFACAKGDIEQMRSLYGPTAASTFETPNGVAIEEVPFCPLSERRSLQVRLGLNGRKTVLFMGSWHGPNLLAVKRIFKCADGLPDVDFLVLGTACLAFMNNQVPANVKLLGVVDEAEKAILFSSVDFCLNPMTTGSGSNLKMLDYFASGTPAISTEFGARGIDVTAGIDYLPTANDLGATIRAAYSMKQQELEAIANHARQLVEEKYSWEIIAREFAVNSGLSVFTNDDSPLTSGS